MFMKILGKNHDKFSKMFVLKLESIYGKILRRFYG